MRSADDAKSLPQLTSSQRLLISFAAVVVLSAWLSGSLLRGPDYDEIEHAHATWLVSEGYRPYHDFFENHPPAVWYVLAPLGKLFNSASDLLMALRFAAAAANALTILALYALAARNVPKLWAAAGLLAAASIPDTLNYLVEFRQDPFATAIVFTAIYLLVRRSPRSITWRYALFAFLSINALLLSPKIVTLLAFFVLTDLALNFAQNRTSVPRIALGHLLGATAATAVTAGWLAAAGLELDTMYDLIVRYNGAFMKAAVFPVALRDRIAAQTLFSLAVATGAATWIVATARRRTTVDPFQIAAALTLLLQLVFITLPYKQYTAPWFLLAGTFIPYCFFAVQSATPRLRALPAYLILIIAMAAAVRTAYSFASEKGGGFDRRYRAFLDRNGLARGTVVAPVPLHPITARDATYSWVLSHDPLGGSDTETIMLSLEAEPFSRRFTREYYRAELENAAPDLIIPTDLAPHHLAETTAYLARHRDHYRVLTFEGVAVFAKR